MKHFIATLLISLSIISRSLYLEFIPLKDKINTNSKDNYIEIINLADALDLDIKALRSGPNKIEYKKIYKRYYMDLKHVQTALEKLGLNNTKEGKEHSLQLFKYVKTLSELRKLPAASAGCLIDTEWILGAKHVLDAAFANQLASLVMPHGIIPIGRVKQVYACPLVRDLALARMHEPFIEVPPVKRFRGTLKMDDKFYAYSDTLHNTNGGVSNNEDLGAEIFGECKPFPGSNLNNREFIFHFNFDPKNPFIIRTYGGDSGGPLFIKAQNTGDPLKDYQIMGVFNPGGNQLAVMNISNQEVNAWIDSVILGTALGTGPAPTLSH